MRIMGTIRALAFVVYWLCWHSSAGRVLAAALDDPTVTHPHHHDCGNKRSSDVRANDVDDTAEVNLLGKRVRYVHVNEPSLDCALEFSSCSISL
jgi:hypothetical protein